jgi:DNA-binding FrmR family transcriptional regulator
MQNFKLGEEDKKYLIASINRVVGVLNSIKGDVEQDHACDESLTQLMACRGAVSRIAQEMIARGVLQCMEEYSHEELEQVITKMFKLDTGE